MPRSLLRGLAATLAVLQALPLWATCGGGGGGGQGGARPPGGGAEQVYHVPWMALTPDDPAPTRGLVLYWFPSSNEEVKTSSLRTSRDLSLYAAQCVAMELAEVKSQPGQAFDVAGKVPIAILTDGSGKLIGRVENQKGFLKAPEVEKLVRDELKRRDEALTAQLTDARAKARAADSDSAIHGFKAVWEERCLFPKKGKEAARELKKLGAPVPEEATDATPAGPIFEGPVAERVVAAMQKGLAAELAGHYAEAGALYASARALDAADPTPARYLGELYRHHTGEWDKARQVFEALLTRPADPLSRAVALHGLGKMTIHEGKFALGLSLLEESVKTYPLALAYRNLAVYWNSEGDAAKTAGYVEQALRLDPEDAYNRVFAAVFMAASGRGEEALRIARENESLLPASYNLAAIYAQNGDKARALALLKRHFFTYERFQAVRGEEMMEARVDAVFASIRDDPRFVALTAQADGRMAMPAH
ncbi:MAG: tetratricopeptide repeat protein [Vicinamibacteria bacterium]